MSKRARCEFRLSAALKAQLAELAHTRHMAMTDILEEAVQTVLAPEPPATQRVLRRLDRLQQEVDALQQAVEVVAETLALFVNVYLSTTSEVPPAEEEEARRRGGRRYARFLKVLEGKLAPEQRRFPALASDSIPAEDGGPFAAG
jgi:hypothetical protein